MNARDRYIAALTFKSVDRVPLEPGAPRSPTLKRWRSEGLPADMNYWDYVRERLGLPGDIETPFYSHRVDSRMLPTFEEKILSHENGHYIVQDWMGAVTEISDDFDESYVRNTKNWDYITRKWLKFPVENAGDWEAMKPRYNPDDPARYPADMPELGKRLAERDYATSFNTWGPFWQLREWFGFENLCVALIEEPELVHEMTDFWQDFVLRVFENTAAHIPLDRLEFPEDMAYKAHCMISPGMIREFLQPVYVAWTRAAKAHGIKILGLDSDGYVAQMIPIWIESGINVCEPMEVAAHNDIVEYRAIYGKQMAYRGGIDKRCIAEGGDVMKQEVLRVTEPLLRDGGFIPGCDHGVPPEVSLENYIEFVRLLAQLTGWL